MEQGNFAYQKKQYTTAFDAFERVAKQGESVAQFNLAVLYKKGFEIYHKHMSGIKKLQKMDMLKLSLIFHNFVILVMR